MALTIKDIAEMAKVSKGTVSRVLNNAPGVGELTRKRILKIIQDLDFQPNASAKGLAAKRTNNIGVIIPHTGKYSMSSHYWPNLLTSITEHAAAKEMNVLLSTTRTEEDIDSAYNSILKGKRVDGLIIGVDQFENRQLKELQMRNFPFVMVGKSIYKYPFFVDVDNIGGAKKMTKYLIGAGHKDIALLAGPQNFLNVQERVFGFEQAMTEAGFDHKKVYYFSYYTDIVIESIKKTLKSNSSITALFVAAGDLLIGALKACKDLNLVIPKDISLVTFDDYPFYEYFSPSITAVYQPIDTLGKTAVNLLFNLIEGSNINPENFIFSTEILIRESSGPSKFYKTEII